MDNIKKYFSRPLTRILLAGFVLVVLAGIGGGLYFSQQMPQQPIDFPHSTHVGIGLQCVFCHTGATMGETAGIPTTEKCWGCHQQIDRQSAELAKLTEFAQGGESIPWVPVFIQPDFVRFDHRPHVARGISCETCHGEVGSMRVARPRSDQNMGWCLDCHTKMEPERKTELTDCSTCHY